MQLDFWHQRWEQNQIGFHSQVVNRYLQRYWSTIKLPLGSRVLVPLCGKTQDMLWLLAQGYQVVGVELSPLAVEQFFLENAGLPSTQKQGEFNVYAVPGIQIYCGDFFALSFGELGHIDAVYDRAALVALPPEMRIDYTAHLAQFLESDAQILLVTFAYPQPEMAGPPFSVEITEVNTLFSTWCAVDLLTSENSLMHEAHFRERGLSRLDEQVYRLQVR
jgi:thiopurine S-methyltransferase